MAHFCYRQTNWSPWRAIRERCLWCCGNQSGEVDLCSAHGCALHSFRLGRASRPGAQPLKAIRSKCIDCIAGAASNVIKCVSKECALWEFRLGKNPFCHNTSRKPIRACAGASPDSGLSPELDPPAPPGHDCPSNG